MADIKKIKNRIRNLKENKKEAFDDLFASLNTQKLNEHFGDNPTYNKINNERNKSKSY